MIIVLVGNKADLEQREVTSEEGQRFAEENGLIFIETSAKTGLNVKEAFQEAASTIHENMQQGEYDLRSENIGIRAGNVSMGDRERSD
eukprot:CAMPEP_0170494088 /NCGR_PEP_ID=MMETSP0208-20121228/14442_1 /TAXON_ID=197538 /ORGANISM="Strombidium inclinatum, Strain S3" /LENGTH=87 /DNA_ID=CAMNT_0010770093 /DNA_START=336 /DNA_END=596 /DNA_ORIENTATION=+